MIASRRRDFLRQGAAMLALGVGGSLAKGEETMDKMKTKSEFAAYQQSRRKSLWDLLGDLPWNHQPAPPRLVKTEKHEGFTLERLVLDLNGLEPVPAILIVPEKCQKQAPGLLFIHWHGGMYDLGKEQLLSGVDAQPAYASVCAERGIVTLAIDSWCFGERKSAGNGGVGELDTFKEMLWRGRVLYGMMMFDEHRALDYLASRPEIDPNRLGALGMSMGSSKAWWLAALDPRLRLCLDVCCLTDFDELIRMKNVKGHGIYYYVPSLLKYFNTSQINELIVPRPRLSVNGSKDDLTPPQGVENVRDYLRPLYKSYGKEEDCRIELFDCPHIELPEMRKLILEWLDRYLVLT